MNQKILAILLLIIGEAISIYIELILAKGNNNILILSLIFASATPFLLYGYIIGYSNFQSIWVVTIISTTFLLIFEPILAYTIFKEIPSKGAIIGFIFGVFGFLSTTFIK
jgi:hypothetical protein